jgi:hypothetical protein
VLINGKEQEVVSEDAITCDECLCNSVYVTKKDNESNLARIRECSEIRKYDEMFSFNFKGTCLNCGDVFVNRFVKNVKFNKGV